MRRITVLQVLVFLNFHQCFGQDAINPECPAPPPVYQELDELLLPQCGSPTAISTTQFCQSETPQNLCTAEEERIDRIVSGIVGCLQDIRHTAAYDMSTEFMSIVAKITDTLMKEKTADDMMYLANRLKEHPKMNYRLWLRAMLSAIERRPDDFKGFQFHQSVQAMPHYYLSTKTLNSLTNARDEETCTLVDESEGVANAVENLLFYFREDIGINSHHGYWHAIHGHNRKPDNKDCPTDGSFPNEDTPCHENRRGELFYYMHRVMLAKYHIERLSHCLPPLLPFQLQIGGVIDSGYIPHLGIRPENNMQWEKRPPNVPLPDEVMEQNTSSDNKTCIRSFTSVRELLENILNIEIAIRTGEYVSNNGEKRPLTIDVLGNMLEASGKNPNETLYGSVHNSGHDLISKAITPKQAVNSSVGVMGDTATALRDPIFYRWHLFIDNLLDTHQRNLPPHEVDSGDYPLLWDKVEITNVSVRQMEHPFQQNQLNTFWSQQIFQIGVQKYDNSCQKSKLCFKNLDHKDFEYSIQIVNPGRSAVNGTIRIFLAPRRREDGQMLTILEQRKYIHALDTFNINEILPGSHTYTRQSLDSTLTTARSSGGYLSGPKVIKKCDDNKCGCGWPHHLLLPKGHEGAGMEFDLIVMITDGKRYRFLYNKEEEENLKGCQMAPLICGITGLNRPYPDVDLPMGYPFERLPYLLPKKKNLPRSKQREYVKYMTDYTEGLSNMHRTTIHIIHNDIFLENPYNPLSSGRQLQSTVMPKSYCVNGSPTPVPPTQTTGWGWPTPYQPPPTAPQPIIWTPQQPYYYDASCNCYKTGSQTPPTAPAPVVWPTPTRQPYYYDRSCNCYKTGGCSG